MIIKKVTIENYLCYFDVKEFELSEGLNIILGENGEGKTKFFEAIDWLFNGDNRNLDLLVSAKALNEAEIGSQFRVRVAITVEQYEEKKIISKSFVVKKTNEKDCTTSNYQVEGTLENKIGERTPVDGRELLDKVFPFEVRKYSLFKGESELNIFKNEDALITLINSFSDAKHYDKYAVKGTFLKERAEKAVEEATKSDNKNQQEYRRLENEIIQLESEKGKVQLFIETSEEQISKTEGYIQDAEKFVSNAEALEMINNRIKNIEQKIAQTQSRINENYTVPLFDEEWMLVNFEPIHKEFAKKVADLSNKKRKLQTEFDKEIGIKEGKKRLKAELLNNSVPLPIGVPSKAHMEEMLRDEICKVCNRPAEKGGDAYNFMFERLEAYLKSQVPEKKEEDDDILFKNNYTSKLFNLSSNHEDSLSSIRHVRTKISDLFEFNRDRKQELEELNDKLNKEIEERDKIMSSSSVGSDKLSSVLKNYNTWQRSIKSMNKELSDYKTCIEEIKEKLKKKKEEKDNIDTKTANTFLIKTRTILRDIETIFKETKEKKFDEFIELLQSKSNSIFDRINFESFTGMIVFNKRYSGGKPHIKIELQEGDGNIFHNPNQSLLTSMHISILFAISELASQLRNESFPMIFDAPTSSFGETKTTEFLNLLYETSNQKILLMKNFLIMDEKSKRLAIKEEFNQVKRDKAFWILLERPFEKRNLKTLNTQVISL